MRLRFGGGSDLVGQGECVVEIWWWLRFCDGGGRGRWMGFVIWKREARGDGWWSNGQRDGCRERESANVKKGG